MENTLAQAIRRQLLPSMLKDILSLAKPRLSSLVLATTGVGIWLAPGSLSLGRIFLTLAGTSLVVASANAFNCYWERQTDRLMKRTRQRALPAGRLEPKVAIYFGALLLGIAIPTLIVAANLLTAILGLIGLVLYVFAYTPLKFKSTLALQVGAIPGAIPPLMGWTAVTGRMDSGGLMLFAILFCWQFTHFLAISLYLREDYARAGIQAYSVVHGEHRTKIMIAMSMVLLIPTTLILVPMGLASTNYGFAASLLGFLLLGFSLLGFVAPKTGRWARSMFLATVAYLPLLFMALIILGAGEH